MHHNVRMIAFLPLALLILVACEPLPVTTAPLNTPVVNSWATPALAPARAITDLDAQSASTAEIARANAQATMDSANATMSAAQTQSQSNANVIAAQVAATAEVARANAQATLYSAGSTQYAAQTQSQYDLQSTQVVGTQNAEAMMAQQYQNALAAGTQTAIANNIATQTQSAAATSQWYIDQDRQRAEQRQAPLAFLWMWCLPMFIVLFAGLALWGFWRWMKIQQANQRIIETPVQAPPVIPHQHTNALPYIESDVIDGSYQVTTPDDEVHDWLDEVKDQLQSDDEKDKTDDDKSK
jgi:hypothetical protein